MKEKQEAATEPCRASQKGSSLYKTEQADYEKAGGGRLLALLAGDTDNPCGSDHTYTKQRLKI